MKNEKKNNQFNGESGNFGLPEGYFQKSASSIMNKIEWEEEHKEFPKLSALKDITGFSVPENYFSKKEQRLELGEYPILLSQQSKNPLTVPVNYFEESKALELSKVLDANENELENFCSLNSLKKQNSFSVPENYFPGNESRLATEVKSKETKVISLFARRIGYAAAAMVLVVMGVWIYNFYFATVQVEDCGTIACVDKQDLVKTKNLERLDDEELYELVDPAALKKKLEGTDSKGTRINNNKDSSLNDISAEDLLDDI